MNISKISRSIIVAVFVVFVIFLGYLDVLSMLNKVDVTSTAPGLMKIGYAILLIAFVLLYVYIKDKLYRMKVKRKLSFVYRYIYLVIAMVGITVYMLYKRVPPVSMSFALFYIICTLVISFGLKKIVFNTSKSDILSVFAMFAVAMIPNLVTNKTMLVTGLCMAFAVVSTLLVLQLLIDELKQRGVRTKKYWIEASLLGICMGICMLFSIHFIVFVLLCIVLLLVTTRLDNTHVSFPKHVMASITQEQREKLYKIERINISKLVLSCITALIISVIVYVAGKSIIKVLPMNLRQTTVMTQVQTNIEKARIQHLAIKDVKGNARQIYSYGKEFVSLSRSYYMTLFIYIVFVEVLALVLKRKYDTKSTVLKAFLILMFCFAAIFQIDVVMMQPITTILLILIAIVNTSNIYLNREERVKMLVAS